MTIALQDFRKALFDHGLLIQMGADGLYGRSGTFERIARAIDDAVSREGKNDGAEVMRFPPAVSRGTFETSGYLASFPTLAGTVHSFVGADKEHRALIAMLEKKEDWTVGQKATGVVLTPAACYPIYPTLGARGPLSAKGATVDVLSWCYRNEPSLEPTRMQFFHQREFVRAGTPEQVQSFRQLWLERGEKIMRALQLPLTVEVATDPFFGRAGKMLVANQREQTLKFELLVPVITDIGPTACVSFNYHQDKFGSSFGLKLPDGSTAHTACVGFGIERSTLALLATHGYDPEKWPSAVRSALWP